MSPGLNELVAELQRYLPGSLLGDAAPETCLDSGKSAGEMLLLVSC